MNPMVFHLQGAELTYAQCGVDGQGEHRPPPLEHPRL